jgi:hypothetical protein
MMKRSVGMSKLEQARTFSKYDEGIAVTIIKK